MFLTSAAFADTWTVDDDGKADFDNIQAAVDAVQWQRAAYYDQNYTGTWATDQAMVDHLAYDGYQVLDANALKSWMDARIDDGEPSVVVFCQDVAAESSVTVKVAVPSNSSPQLPELNVEDSIPFTRFGASRCATTIGRMPRRSPWYGDGASVGLRFSLPLESAGELGCWAPCPDRFPGSGLAP